MRLFTKVIVASSSIIVATAAFSTRANVVTATSRLPSFFKKSTPRTSSSVTRQMSSSSELVNTEIGVNDVRFFSPQYRQPNIIYIN